MRYAGIIKNDFAAAPGVCLSFFVQGCPIRCRGCHNPECWDFNGGKQFTEEVVDEVLVGLAANGLKRTFCVMGGEPLCGDNLSLTTNIINIVKNFYPDIKIWLWTGYEFEQIKKLDVIKFVDVIVDGQFILEQRDITLPYRGSTNQRVINVKESLATNKTILYN